MQARTKVLIAVLVVVAAMCGGFGVVLYATGAFGGTLVREGTTLRINARNGFGLWCGASEALARDPITREQQRDSATLARWHQEGAIWYLAHHDRVQVASVSAELASVQVLTGQHAGRSCWLPSSALTR